MKKTLIYAILSLFVAFAVACKKDSAEEKEEQPLYPSSDYQLSAEGKVLEKWLNPETVSVDMQKDIKLREVTSIAREAFKDCKKLASIVISDKVEHIRYRVFENCTQLTNVHIPDGVITLGFEAFSKCYNLASITIPSTIQSIGNQAFYNSGLRIVTIKDGVKNIETGAFRDCRGLITINFPNTLTHIGDYAFYDCYNLPSVNLPKSIESIDREAFKNCGSLTTVTVNATTPPVIKSTTFSKFTVKRISVPASSVNAYKTAESWSEFRDKIVALP